jgi:hypothetical protein
MQVLSILLGSRIHEFRQIRFQALNPQSAGAAEVAINCGDVPAMHGNPNMLVYLRISSTRGRRSTEVIL